VRMRKYTKFAKRCWPDKSALILYTVSRFLMWQDDDNLAELATSTRDFVTCGPCQPHEAATNHQHFFNWNILFGLI
jgi:hypothetical protein